MLEQQILTSTAKQKLVSQSRYTHISLTLRQTGQQGEVLSIGVLLFKSAFTIEKILQGQQGEGAIISGKVLDTSLKPCMVYLNPNDANLSCILGPNRIYYDASNGDDYKVHVPDNYLQMPRHPLLSCQQPVIEIYGVLTSNREYKLANDMSYLEKEHDVDQRTDLRQDGNSGIQAGFRAFQVPNEDFKGLSMALSEALSPNECLLDKPGQTQSNGSGQTMQIRNQRQPGTAPPGLANRLNFKTATSQANRSSLQQQQPEIKKTRAQLLREQNAAQKIQQPARSSAQMNQSACFGGGNQQASTTFRDFGAIRNGRPIQNNGGASVFQNQKSPVSFSRENNSFAQFQSQQPRQQLNQTHCMTPNNNNNSSHNRMQSAINQVNFNSAFRPQQSIASTGFGQQQQKLAPPPTFDFRSQQQQQSSFQQQQVQQPQQSQQWQQAARFQQPQQSSQWQQTNAARFQQQPSQLQPAFSQQQPIFGSNNQSSQRQPWKPFQQTQFVSNGSSSIHPPQVQMDGDHQSSYFQQSQQLNQTPLPVRFAVNGTQSKVFDSKKSHKDTSLLPIQTQQELQASEVDFNSLGQEDQVILRGYLTEMCSFGGTHQELEAAEQLMFTNPMQFYQVYCMSVQAIKLQEEQQKQQLTSKVGDNELVKESAEVQQPLISVQDFSNIHLFLINFAEKNCACSKYIDAPRSTKKILQAVTNPDDSMTAEQGLQEIILSKPIPRNDGFAKLYRSRSQQEDLVFVLHREKFKSHQFVMQQSSDYMRGAMQKNQAVNVQHLGQRLNMMTFDLPDWVSPSALQNFLRFCYTTEFKMQQTGSSAMRKDRPQEALDLFRLACYFYCDTLQECLLAREVIPNMNAYSAILFLMELYSHTQSNTSQAKREPTERVKVFLSDFCMFYLAKNLPVILRQQERHNLLKLPQQALYTLFKDSLYYIIDSRADIQILLEFAAQIIANDDIFVLYSQIHSRMTNCCGFDQQHIPKMSDIREMDYQTKFGVEIMQGFDYSEIPPQSQDQKTRQRARDSCALDITTQEQLDKQRHTAAVNNLDTSETKACEAFGPKQNVFTFSDGQSDTQEIKDPTFECVVDLKDSSNVQHMEAGKPGLSHISEAFDIGRRSWHLKIDIAQPSGDISLWILERGEPCVAKNQLQTLHRSVPIKFTSQLMEMQIVDPGLKHRKTVIFFSFSHDKNQIIGHKNFANLDQLTNKEHVTVRVKIFEHIIHSAMIHHFASTFQRKFKEESALEQTIRMCPQTFKSKPGLFSQPIHMIYWLLSSDQLKVEDENTVLSFIFHYSNLVREKQGAKIAVQAVDILTKCLRFNFLDMHNLMSAVRKNPSIQASSVMSDSFQKEMQERLKLEKPGIVRKLSLSAKEEIKPVEELHYCGKARKYFNTQKLEGQGRQKLLKSSNISVALAEEFYKWAFESKIQEIDQQQARMNPYQMQSHQLEQHQVRQMQQELIESRRNAQNTARELQELKIKYQNTVSHNGHLNSHAPPLHQQPYQHQPNPPAHLQTQNAQQRESPPRYQPTRPLGINEQIQPHKENQPPSKLGVVSSTNQDRLAAPLYAPQESKQTMPPSKPYVQAPQVPIVAKRDPPGALGQPRRQPPSSLMNKSLGQVSFNSEQLVPNHGGANRDAATSLNLSTNTLLENGAKRQPPASLAGNNTSMDLSAIMNKLNQSPAPSTRQRVPNSLGNNAMNSKKNANAVNNYLASKNGSKEGCHIF